MRRVIIYSFFLFFVYDTLIFDLHEEFVWGKTNNNINVIRVRMVVSDTVLFHAMREYCHCGSSSANMIELSQVRCEPKKKQLDRNANSKRVSLHFIC